MRKAFLLPLLPLLLCAAAATAQEDAAPAEPAPPEAQTTRDIKRQFLELERRIYDQGEIGLRRLEHVEARIDSSQRHIDRLFLIFTLGILVIFVFLGSSLKSRQKSAEEKIRYALRDADNLMADIKRELARPEMEHLRISQLLKQLLRKLREDDRKDPSRAYIVELRNAVNDPFLPAALHFIARILVAEHDGNWNTAVQMLEQLREMDPKDPDVLLHLSHVHKNLATLAAGDSKARKLHQRLSYQYYGQFNTVMQAEGFAPGIRQLPAAAAEQPSAIPKPAPNIAPKPAAPPPASISAPPQPSAPPRATTPPPPSVAPQPKPATPVAPPPSIPPKPIPPAPPRAAPPPQPQPKPATPVAPPPSIPPKPISPAPPSAAPPPQPQPKPATPVAPPPSVPPKPAPPPAPPPGAPSKPTTPPAAPSAGAAKPATTALARVPSSNALAVRLKTINLKPHFKQLRQALARLPRHTVAWLGKASEGVASLLRERENGALPFLPVPSVSDIPEKASGSERSMWQALRGGDLLMAKATEAKSVRERNRIVDSAIVSYTQAQSHSTNKTLYHNWGLALLAKALHMPEKKRAPFYNAAVDKFLAGNVIAPHYFDFYLASLYAIIGNAAECRRWLQTARDNNGLDIDALRQAPDFDSVRQEAWFDAFLEG